MNIIIEYVSSQFGNPRGIFGKICCLLQNIINKTMYRSVIVSADAYSDSNILDIGFGNGYLISNLYKKSNASIYGIDISEDMLNTASKANRQAIENNKIHLSIGDCCNLQFDNEMFDIVTSVNTIYFWNDTVKGLQEIHRTLKKGGIFYNASYSKEYLKKLSYTKKGFKFFEKEDYIRLGKQAGFPDVSIKEIMNGKSYIISFIK